MKPLNPRVVDSPPSGIRRFFDLAAGMDDVISLGVGEPDFTTPWRATEAGIFALEKGKTAYTSNAGLIELREAICNELKSRYRVSYDPSQECIITGGVSEGLDLALRVLLSAGDEVVVPEPSYVAYGPCIAFSGGVAVGVSTDAADGFKVDVGRIRAAITSRTKAILISSPANPTGAVQDIETIGEIVRLAVEHDLYIISDEIYARLSFLGPHSSVAAVPGAWERTVLLNGFSKAFAMTGWRVGYVCAPEPIASQLLKMHQYTMLCAPHMSQHAALEAIRNCQDDVDVMVADYDRRRRIFVKGLNDIGLACPEPGGGFYAFPSIRSTGLTSEEFAERLLSSERVAVVPGNVFGPSGEGHIRCCYATALPLLEEALDRTARFIASIG